MSGRNIAVSDIHGEAGTYQKLIKSLNNDDNLYILGDLIDRGPCGIDIIKDIIERKKDPNNNPSITVFMGNHELMMLDSFKEIENLGVSKEEFIKIADRHNGYLQFLILTDEVTTCKEMIENWEGKLKKAKAENDIKKIDKCEKRIQHFREKYDRLYEDYKVEYEKNKEFYDKAANCKEDYDKFNKIKDSCPEFKNWYDFNGGDTTVENLIENCKSKESIDEILNFLEDTVLMKKIETNNQEIFLVHAAPPPNVKQIIGLKPNSQRTYRSFMNGSIKNKDDYLKSIVWDRKNDNKDRQVSAKSIADVEKRQKAITDAGIKIVFGHDKQDNGIRTDQLDKDGNPMCVCIDTSVAYNTENSLTVFDLDNFRVDHTIEHIDYMDVKKEQNPKKTQWIKNFIKDYRDTEESPSYALRANCEEQNRELVMNSIKAGKLIGNYDNNVKKDDFFYMENLTNTVARLLCEAEILTKETGENYIEQFTEIPEVNKILLQIKKGNPSKEMHIKAEENRKIGDLPKHPKTEHEKNLLITQKSTENTELGTIESQIETVEQIQETSNNIKDDLVTLPNGARIPRTQYEQEYLPEMDKLKKQNLVDCYYKNELDMKDLSNSREYLKNSKEKDEEKSDGHRNEYLDDSHSR